MDTFAHDFIYMHFELFSNFYTLFMYSFSNVSWNLEDSVFFFYLITISIFVVIYFSWSFPVFVWFVITISNRNVMI